MHRSRIRLAWLPLALALPLATSERSRADIVYLALGDSVTFGFDPSTPASFAPSLADQGFVKPFADSLAAENGGVRPRVLNLAIAGELSTSFFDAAPPPGWTLRTPEINLNYPDGTTPQNDLMLASINSIHAAGDSVGYVSFLIGANDIFYLVGTPAFQGASESDQVAMIGAAIGGVQNRYLGVLTNLATLAPEAEIILAGYYNPFPSGTQEHGFYDLVLSFFNPTIEADAKAFGATYVDLYTPFSGRELELTNIGIGDVHPNQAGYATISDAIIRARAVPEPTSLALTSLGAFGVSAYARRRKARAA